MNAKVIKANKAAFDFGLSGGKIWVKNKIEITFSWEIYDFENLNFSAPDNYYVPDNEYAEIVKAFFDGEGGIEYYSRGWLEWLPIKQSKELILEEGLDKGRKYRLKPKRQRLANGQIYYFVSSALNILEDKERYFSVDDHRYKCGNYFLKKEQAEKALVKINQAIEEVHNENL